MDDIASLYKNLLSSLCTGQHKHERKDKKAKFPDHILITMVTRFERTIMVLRGFSLVFASCSAPVLNIPFHNSSVPMSFLEFARLGFKPSN